MKNTFVSLLLLISTLGALHAHAQRTSGGGNIVYCSQGTLAPPTMTLLDYYDATRPNGYGFHLDLGAGETADEKVEYVLNRLSKIDPFRAELYRKFAKEFDNDAAFSTQGPWATDSNDLGSGYFLQSTCSIKRAVILRSDDEVFRSNSEKKFEVSNMWNDFDEQTKAGMKLHEIAYREAQFRGATNSLAIRRYVAFISSKEIFKLNYQEEILKSGLIFWGQPTNMFGKTYYGNVPVSTEYPAASRSVRFSNDMFKKGIVLKNFGEEKTIITLEGTKLKCFGLSISQKNFYESQKLNYKALLTVFRALSSEGGLYINQIPDEFQLLISGCGDITLNSRMFKNAKVDFSLVMDSSKNIIEGTYLNGAMDSEALLYVNVKSGHISGRDVSGKTCSIPLDGQGIRCD